MVYDKPKILKSIFIYLIGILGHKRLAKDLNHFDGVNFKEFYSLLNKRNDQLNEVLSLWKSQDLDVVLSSAFIVPSIKHQDAKYLKLILTDSMLHNFIQFPSGVIPATTIREDEQYFDEPFDDHINKSILNTMKDSKGLPIGIQITSLPFEDEKALAVMKILEDHFKFSEKVQYPY